MTKKEYDKLSGIILDSAISVHKEMGPGLLESVYEYCMVSELKSRGIKVESQVTLPLYYKGEKLEKEFRIDLLVENEIIIELKAHETILPVHEAQLISYLKLAEKWLGILINFNTVLLKNGYRRFVNGYLDED